MAISAATAMWMAAAATAASAASNAYNQRQAGKRADREGRRQAQAAEQARLQQEQEFNRANRKQADVGSLLDPNAGALSGGPNLTGGGASFDPNAGMNDMLGGGGMLGR